MAQNEAKVSKYMIGSPNIVQISDYKKEKLINYRWSQVGKLLLGHGILQQWRYV